MELKFGEFKTKTISGSMEIEDVRKVRDYHTVQNVRLFTLPVRVSSFDEVRSEFENLLASAERGECLDVTLTVQLDQKTGLPKMVKKVYMDVNSKI